jgi:lipopolysaccharide biosynthesis regulator YciM
MFESQFSKLNRLFNKSNFSKFEEEFFYYEKNNSLCEKCYNLFGIYLQKKEDYLDAIKYFQLAIAKKSKFIEAKVNLAFIHIKYTKDIETAKQLLFDVIGQDTNNKNANFLLAEIFFSHEQYEDCIRICETITNIDPLLVVNYAKLGLAYLKINRSDKAILNFKKSIQLDPDNYQNHYNLYLAYKNISNVQECLSILQKLIKKFPHDRKAYLELSNLYRGIGNFRESDEVLEKMLKNFGMKEIEAPYELLSSPQYAHQDELVRTIEKNILNQNNDFRERVGYGLFKYYDRKKNFGVASEYLKKSLQLTSIRLNYNFNYEKEQFQFLQNTFNNNFFKQRGFLANSQKYSNLFIVGLHRSGSTLLEQIISTNQQFVSLGEITLFPDLITKYFPDQQLERFQTTILNTPKQIFSKIGEEYQKKINSGSAISIDKQLINFRMIGFILACLPNALIIHIKRNRNDNLFSMLSNYYANDHAPWSYDLDVLSAYYEEYLNLMNHWNMICAEKIINIQYEELVSNPKNEISKILNKLNFKWNEDYLNFQSNKNIVQTQSVFQVRENLNSSSIDRWTHYKSYFPNFFK